MRRRNERTIYTKTDVREYLRKVEKKPFDLSEASKSSRYTMRTTFRGIESKHTIIYTPILKRVNVKHLGLIQHVKSKVKEIEPNISEPPFFYYGKVFPFGSISRIWKGYEIDAVSAYWREANSIGACSEDMFQKYYKGKQQKLARLMAVGACYSKRHLFDLYPNSMGGEKKDVAKGVKEPYAPKTYKTICSNVVRMLLNIQNEYDQSIFYWVDQIYISGKINEKKIEKIAAKYNHRVKIKPVIITRKNGFFVVNCGKELREFCLK